MRDDRPSSNKPDKPERPTDKPAERAHPKDPRESIEVRHPKDSAGHDPSRNEHKELSKELNKDHAKEHKASSKDITPALKGWDYESGTINVRKISGLDGQVKLQMRLDLGLLQMELNGRPDGAKPHGCESLLDFFEQQLREHRSRNGTDLGFHLTGDQCQSLREEALMYYQRYLSLFVLGEFNGVVRDTERNLRVLDLCGRFAVDEQDRLILEQYRPYIIMMNTRAQASMLYKEKQYSQALNAIAAGLERIREFFARFGQEEAYGQSNEVKVLKKFAKEIRRKLPIDPMRKLQNQLDRAVKNENYERAARLRDEIQAMKETQRDA